MGNENGKGVPLIHYKQDLSIILILNLFTIYFLFRFYFFLSVLRLIHYHVFNFIFRFLSTATHVTWVGDLFFFVFLNVIWQPAELEFYNVTDLSW